MDQVVLSRFFREELNILLLLYASLLFKFLLVFLVQLLLLHSLLIQTFMTQGRPGRPQLFHKQGAGRGHAEKELSWAVP